MPWEPEADDVIAGRYELEEFLGQGGFAKAYRALDRTTGETVVVKHPNYTGSQNDQSVIEEYFEKEAETLQRIAAAGGHEYVMDLYDTVRERDIPFLVVELVEGEEIDTAIEKYNAPMTDDDQVRQVGIKLADAMGFLHENEIVYRDLKPENVMLAEDGTPTLIDFNTATGFDSTGDPSTGNQGTTILGPFKPREVAEASRTDVRQGPWSDVYSIGKILLYLLKGSVPKKDGVNPHDFGAECADYLAEIVERATQSDYRHRYRNATVLRDVLEARDPTPPSTATIRYSQTGQEFPVEPGDTLGREGADGPAASITIEDPQGDHISSVQIQFEKAGDAWYLVDKSLNGTYVQRGSGWKWVLSGDGRERLKEKGEDHTDRHGEEPPESMQLNDGDFIALVHPTYGVNLTFEAE
ncbi:FHA domain-containing serine/threonine-protein kinase [Haloarcula onubensis]|uniref:non-specific serine/threonine protein kinase n=1 Tax=Haloarcula onubensis TaxID=2950539 RepID=A0ABU2FQ07_9EURY|nr:FHA domain-containing serine/threonine-protein kinase [Halomicroarcula sp. S3CR25-11]MDS0282843.1 FHA domain-containing serine/threonine-protein kinase [Halomicroarcula sp. S3CR25-11]